MEGKTNRFIIILILLLFNSGILKSGYREDIYKAYIKGNMSEWREVINHMEQEKNKTDDFMLELLNYHYGYIAWCIEKKKTQEAEKHLEQGYHYISILEKRKTSLWLVKSYKSAFYGYRIGLNKLKAPILGMKSIENAREAMAIGPFSPFGYIQYGNIQYYMPPLFGGSKREALSYYQKARNLYEGSGKDLRFDWNYLNLLILIARTHEALGQYQEAKREYEAILRREPACQWVRQELYPKLINRKI